MKTVAMHQPHYFPWLGYLDKMAKADEFVVLDEVQFTDGSPMSRNRFLQVDGEAKLLSLSVEKKGYLEKPTRDVRLSNWPKTRKKHRGFIECNYRKTPYFDEVMPLVAKVLEADCDTLLDLDMASIEMLRSAYGVETPLVLQSSLPYDTEAKNNDLVLGLCRACGADVYLSGRGARAYMDDRSLFLAISRGSATSTRWRRRTSSSCSTRCSLQTAPLCRGTGSSRSTERRSSCP